MKAFRFIFQLIALFAFVFVCFSCKSSINEATLHGAWRNDSLFDFYNGFTFMDRSPQQAEVHVYKGEHTMLRRGMGHEKKYYYALKDNQILISDSVGKPGTSHLILKLDSNQLILKREKKPIFGVEKQVRYEVRFFTRIPLDSLK